MPLETFPYDPARYIRSDAGAVAYLESAFESGDAETIADALDVVARARGTKFISRAGPELAGIVKLLSELGLRLGVLPRETA